MAELKSIGRDYTGRTAVRRGLLLCDADLATDSGRVGHHVAPPVHASVTERLRGDGVAPEPTSERDDFSAKPEVGRNEASASSFCAICGVEIARHVGSAYRRRSNQLPLAPPALAFAA